MAPSRSGRVAGAAWASSGAGEVGADEVGGGVGEIVAAGSSACAHPGSAAGATMSDARTASHVDRIVAIYPNSRETGGHRGVWFGRRRRQRGGLGPPVKTASAAGRRVARSDVAIDRRIARALVCTAVRGRWRFATRVELARHDGRIHGAARDDLDGREAPAGDRVGWRSGGASARAGAAQGLDAQRVAAGRGSDDEQERGERPGTAAGEAPAGWRSR